MSHFLLFLRKNKPEYEISIRSPAPGRLNFICVVFGGHQLPPSRALSCPFLGSSSCTCSDISSPSAVRAGSDGFVGGSC